MPLALKLIIDIQLLHLLFSLVDQFDSVPVFLS